jgi:hypothetical protein
VRGRGRMIRVGFCDDDDDDDDDDDVEMMEIMVCEGEQ